MNDRKFDWDIHNISHIAEHGITPEDAEYVLNNVVRFCEVTDDYLEFRRCVIGIHPNGKFVKLIYNLRHGKHRVVSAFFFTK
jgi:uncharacterized DUF497 family protein